jgi:hypothetical protein
MRPGTGSITRTQLPPQGKLIPPPITSLNTHMRAAGSARSGQAGQQPLQMPFSLPATALVSASIATSGSTDESVAEIPPAVDLADPVVMDDPVVDDDPEELAVPTLLVPRGVGTATFAELPAPLGSLPELLRPPAFAGPDGTPLTPAVPAPAEPALGEPTALPLPADGPLAAPPALPPPLAPPPLCANECIGPMTSTMAMIDAVADILVIGISFLDSNGSTRCQFRGGTISLPRH